MSCWASMRPADLTGQVAEAVEPGRPRERSDDAGLRGGGWRRCGARWNGPRPASRLHARRRGENKAGLRWSTSVVESAEEVRCAPAVLLRLRVRPRRTSATQQLASARTSSELSVVSASAFARRSRAPERVRSDRMAAGSAGVPSIRRDCGFICRFIYRSLDLRVVDIHTQRGGFAPYMRNAEIVFISNNDPTLCCQYGKRRSLAV